MLKKMTAAVLLIVAAILPPLVGAQNIERIEPANWWVGMHSDKLQLMVHGEHIADYNVELTYPNVRIDSVVRAVNHNYLFINLTILPKARAGTLPLQFKKGTAVVNYAYPLQQRVPNSAQRPGFTNADVILNLMPDRFANGDPKNDNVDGYPDQLNRASNDAGRHGGDIQGMIDHLDYIADMGYTMIWPTPLTENNQKAYSYHGYAATDTYKIDPRYGSNDDYKRLVTLAKAKGIGIIDDIVLNHIGSEHWWMKDMPMPDWISYDGKFVATSNIHSTIADPYSSVEDRNAFTRGWFSQNMPDMNQQNPYVATYQIQNSIWWVEYAGLSGIRVDTYGYSDTAFLSQWSRRMMEEYPRLNIVGEEWNMNPVIVSNWQRGKVHANGAISYPISYLPSLMDFPLNNALITALSEKEDTYSGLLKLYEAMVNDTQYPNPQNLVLFEGNHDLSRLYTLMGDDAGLARLGMAYLATAPRIPQYYYGTEILMTSMKERNDGETRKDFPGGWAGDTVNAFTGAGLTDEQRSTQQYLKKLLNWRKTQPVLFNGKMLHYVPDHGTYTYFRYDPKHIVMVVLNKNNSATELKTGRFHEVLAGHVKAIDAMSRSAVDISTGVTVPARSALILEIQ